MKEVFEKPELEIVKLDESDVICSSLGCGSGGDFETPEDNW